MLVAIANSVFSMKFTKGICLPILIMTLAFAIVEMPIC